MGDKTLKEDREVTPRTQPTQPRPSNWAAPAALAIAIAAAGVAIWAVLRTPNESTQVDPQLPAVTAQESADAKASTCDAFETVRTAVSIQTNMNLGADPVAREAVAANARLATFGGGSYLLSRLSPAIPPELSNEVRAFANNLQDIGMRQLVGLPNTDPGLAGPLADAQASSAKIAELCK